MELHTLKPPAGSRTKRRRVGRGPGSGLGKTSGRGHKGAGQRSGYKRKAGHEGGQMPLHRRVPKRGFKNIFRTEYEVVNVADLARLSSEEINGDVLREAGLVRKKHSLVKLLGNGSVEKAFTVKLNAFSRSAVKKIEEAGGKTEVV